MPVTQRYPYFKFILTLIDIVLCAICLHIFFELSFCLFINKCVACIWVLEISYLLATV